MIGWACSPCVRASRRRQGGCNLPARSTAATKSTRSSCPDSSLVHPSTTKFAPTHGAPPPETNAKRRNPRRHTKRNGTAASAGAVPPRGARRMGGGAPPGARASRPHPLRWVAAPFPRDVAPGHPAVGNPMGSAEADSWRRCRSSRVEKMGEAVPVLYGRDARAPGGPRPMTSSQPSASIGLFVYLPPQTTG